jgi:hypothetical protein
MDRRRAKETGRPHGGRKDRCRDSDRPSADTSLHLFAVSNAEDGFGRFRAKGEGKMKRNRSLLLGIGIGLFEALAVLTARYVAAVMMD